MRVVTGKEDGSVTAFVILVVTMFIVCTGLVVDGARIVSAKVELSDVAGNAARAGAQEFRSLRSGSNDLNVKAAVSTAMKYLRSRGVSGTASCDGHSVTVHTSTSVNMTIMGAFGVRSRRVTSTQYATPMDE